MIVKPVTAPPPEEPPSIRPEKVELASVETPLDDSVFVFPATLAQRRFWLLDQLQAGGNPALNMPVPMRLHGRLEHDALRRALNELVARHEALRTTFSSERGELRQLIAPHLQVDLPQRNERSVGETDRAGVAARAIRDEAELCFDLRKGPLLRAQVIDFGDNEHLLLLTLHHIITDGWSNGVLIRELWECYTAFAANQQPSLPELQIQFADYADWQHGRLAANDFAWQREYWRQQLAGDLPVLDLPTDRPRVSGRDNSGASHSRIMPAPLVDAAKALATREGASPFMLFLAIFEVLLHRYTGQDDFLVTTPNANRQRQEFEALIGPFVNPLLVRADLRDNPTFSELLGRVRGVTLDAFVNQDVPFELLLDEFQPSRLQVNFLHQAAFVENTKLPSGLLVEPVNCSSAGTVYELSASVLESAESVRLEIEYNSSLFEAPTVERMIGHYVTLLESAIADPTRRVSDLTLLSSAEVSQLEPESPPTGLTLDIRTPLLERVMERTDAMTVRHGKREMSCAELLARMERARSAVRDGRSPSDLDHAAAWVAHWRARLDSALPAVTARSPTMDATIASACLALREALGLRMSERIASFSTAGVAATEELGAALLSDAMILYPTPELLAESAAALATWLERERIAVAFLPAATWNRLAVSFGRKVAKPSRLRLVIVTEGETSEGGFGRVAPSQSVDGVEALTVQSRSVVEGVGTTSLDGKRFPAAQMLRVLDRRGDRVVPAGVIGELACIDGGTCHRLGEMARWKPDGSIDRLGRVDEQVYERGFRVDRRRIEQAFCTLPGVRHAVVRTTRGEIENAYTAYLLPDAAAGPLPSDAAARRLLRERGVPEEVAAATFIRLKELPVRVEDGRFNVAALPPPVVARPSKTSEPVRPYLGLQLQLIAIWEEVLGVRGIGIRDDFFDLGGNSLLAMRMLQRAATACGKEILPTALFMNPTIEHLAGEMAREVIKDSPAVLRVHETGKRTPFFYLHGDLSGGGFYTLKLSRSLGADQPFYVLPPLDIRSSSAAPSIEEMAAAHISALRAVRPNGPYVIGGFCVGGLVAYEVARQLEASGDAVEMLVIIDAAPEDKILSGLRACVEKAGELGRWNNEEKVARFGRWMVRRVRLAEWYAMKLGAKVRFASAEIRKRVVSAATVFRSRERSDRNGSSVAANIALERDLPSAFLWASAGYRPQQYHGKTALLLSEDVAGRGHHLARHWRRLAPDLTVRPLIGTHLECITAHVATLAETIDGCLQHGGGECVQPSPEIAVAVSISGQFGN